MELEQELVRPRDKQSRVLWQIIPPEAQQRSSSSSMPLKCFSAYHSRGLGVQAHFQNFKGKIVSVG